MRSFKTTTNAYSFPSYLSTIFPAATPRRTTRRGGFQRLPIPPAQSGTMRHIFTSTLNNHRGRRRIRCKHFNVRSLILRGICLAPCSAVINRTITLPTGTPAMKMCPHYGVPYFNACIINLLCLSISFPVYIPASPSPPLMSPSTIHNCGLRPRKACITCERTIRDHPALLAYVYINIGLPGEKKFNTLFPTSS